MSLRLLLLLQVSFQVFSFRCRSHSIPTNSTFKPQGRRLIPPPVDVTSWTPYSISFYLVDDTGGGNELSTLLESEIFPAVTSYYSKVLTVNPLISGQLKATIETCDGVPVPESFLSDGIATDLLLLVTTAAGAFEAWATPCQFVSDEFHRPVIGHIHLQGLEQHLNMTWGQLFASVVHQVAHVTAFHVELLPYFMGETGEYFGTEMIVSNGQIRGSSASFVISPTVLAKARATFGCESLQGLELESTADPGDAAIHWEKRIMYGDFMSTRVNAYDVVFSDVSMALFEDSGWFRVNYAYTSEVIWGYHRGCSWLLQSCISAQTAIETEFCDSASLPRCDYTYTKKGACDLQTSTTLLPSLYQYFNDPYLGGTDRFADHCPVVVPDPAQDCTGTISSPEVNNEVYGETVSRNSRCIEGTFVSETAATPPRSHTSCHKVTCEGSVATITIGLEVAKCTPDGRDTTVRGYQGVVHCPTSDVLCRPAPCYNNCHGRGKCESGKCVCEDGYTGDWCEVGKVIGLIAAYLVL